MGQTRVALVSGANRGIGLEIARQLARHGLLTVIGSRDLERGLEAAGALRAEGLELPAIELDVTDETSVARAVAETGGLLERIDVLVNNAGVYLDESGRTDAAALSVAPALVMRSFDVNTLGPLRMIQAVAPIMQANGYGRIVNLSSTMGQFAQMGKGAVGYRASKAALNVVTRVVAAELGGANIKVNAVHPGWVKTDMGREGAPREVAQGADTPLWLATLPDDGPTGGFFCDRKPIPW